MYAALRHSNFEKFRFLCYSPMPHCGTPISWNLSFCATHVCRIAALQFRKIKAFVLLTYAALRHSNFVTFRFLRYSPMPHCGTPISWNLSFCATHVCRIAALQFRKIKAFVLLTYAALRHSNFVTFRFLRYSPMPHCGTPISWNLSFCASHVCRIAALQFRKIKAFVLLTYAALRHSNFVKFGFLCYSPMPHCGTPIS